MIPTRGRLEISQRKLDVDHSRLGIPAEQHLMRVRRCCNQQQRSPFLLSGSAKKRCSLPRKKQVCRTTFASALRQTTVSQERLSSQGASQQRRTRSVRQKVQR